MCLWVRKENKFQNEIPHRFLQNKKKMGKHLFEQFERKHKLTQASTYTHIKQDARYVVESN